MKKTIVIIFTLLFALACFSVAAENSSAVSTTDPPLLLNIYGNGPLTGGPGALMPPGAPPIPPGAGLSGAAAPGMAGGHGCSTTYGIDITPKKVQQVLSTVKRARKYLKPGKLWILRGAGGEMEIRGGIMYQGAVVSVVEFNPVNGSVLPAGYRPVVYQENVSLSTIRKQLDTIVNNLQVLEGVWYREPEGCWIVPLVYKGEVIASLKIYYDGIHVVPVVPDYEATKEMAYYGS